MSEPKRVRKQTVTCIVCPIGCTIRVKVSGSTVIGLEGNTCARGKEYAKDEVLHPKRTLTSSIMVLGGLWPLVSVRTSRPIPKMKIKAVMKAINVASVKAPVEAGQILIRNAARTGADIIATRSIAKSSSRA